jgi:hypothetical protein
MSNKYKEPRITSSKFDDRCTETNLPIKKGETILLDPKDMSVFHTSSSKFKKFKEALLNRETY